jgi:hypothetical protein
MLAHAKHLLEHNRGGIVVNPKCNKLITALRTAVDIGEGGLDKEASFFYNSFDAFRMFLQF